MNTAQELTNPQRKQLAFLEETASFYNLGNRCVDSEDHCKYHLDGKPGCAIGRHIEDKELCQKFDDEVFGVGYNVSNNHVFSRLPSHLQELGEYFLYKVQKLHDSSINWTNEGLSEHGKETVDNIKKEFNLFHNAGTPPANS